MEYVRLLKKSRMSLRKMMPTMPMTAMNTPTHSMTSTVWEPRSGSLRIWLIAAFRRRLIERNIWHLRLLVEPGADRAQRRIQQEDQVAEAEHHDRHRHLGAPGVRLALHRRRSAFAHGLGDGAHGFGNRRTRRGLLDRGGQLHELVNADLGAQLAQRRSNWDSGAAPGLRGGGKLP